MYVSLFDRYHFYAVLDQADDDLAQQIRQRVGAGGIPDTYVKIANWAGNGMGQRGRRLREAIEESKWIALRNLKAKLGGIKLDDVWPLLLEICHDLALYIGGSAIAGAVLGAAVGSLGLGIGAVPGALAGTAAGAEIGQLLLGFIGLKSVIEYMLDKLPVAIDEYRKGFLVAWGPMLSMRDMFSERPASSYNFESNAMAAGNFARGHEIIIMALLMGIVTYLGKGKGNLKALMAEASSHSKLGPKFATWLEQNERELSASPVLQVRPKGGGREASKNSPAGAKPLTDPRAVGNSEKGAKKPSNFSAYTGDELAENFVGPLSQNSYANRIVGKVTAPIDFDGHIFAAEIKANGNVVGGHSTATGKVQVIPGTASAPNAQGVYSAKIQVADPANPGQFIPKEALNNSLSGSS